MKKSHTVAVDGVVISSDCVRMCKQRRQDFDDVIDRAAGGKLLDKNAKESWEIIENLALYDHEDWDDPRDFAKPEGMRDGTNDESDESVNEELTGWETKAKVETRSRSITLNMKSVRS
uniref:MAK10-like protein n=1 Tax=Tanacetum cinerariifolium TaxID=118510 RepID=A0A699H8D3_TANCI|nr:MAK10-like protein [Tanacetum cinerariifolium]